MQFKLGATPVVDDELVAIEQCKLANEFWFYVERLCDLASVPTLVNRKCVLCSGYDKADGKRVGLSEQQVLPEKVVAGRIALPAR